MTRRARSDLTPVRSPGFGLVASGTLHRLRRAAVLVVASSASLVSFRRGAMLLSMAGSALGLHLPAVWLVAALALLVAGVGGFFRRGVARFARGLEPGRPVRQTTMTTLTGRVAGERRRPRDLSLVAASAQIAIAGGEDEIVRRVTGPAPNAVVKLCVRLGGLVTRAALAHPVVRLARRGVRIVTPHAGARDALGRMVRIHPRMARCTGLLRAPPNVVRGVAARALRMRLDSRSAEHSYRLVTGSARHRGALVEGVGLVAPDALPVAIFEQSVRADLRLGDGMTRHARPERLRSRCMLMLVTRGAYFDGRPALRGVIRGDLVARLAGSRLWRLVDVRAVASHAFARSVHFDCRRFALRLRMAAAAVLGRENTARSPVRSVSGAIQREDVARGAVRGDAVAEAIRRLGGRVPDRCLLLVARGATGRRHDAHLALCNLVAARTSNASVQDMNAVPAHSACRLPRERNVHAQSVRAALRSVQILFLKEGFDNREFFGKY
jgi:hypothetical protein